MFYYIYQITNLVNNKIYVGVHKTTNLDDGYMGSGKIIKRAIEKHGIDNFKKDILEMFDNSDAMYAKEKELVTDEFLLREDTYNLRRGGTGGFDYINKLGINNSRLQYILGGNAIKCRYEIDTIFRNDMSLLRTTINNSQYKAGKKASGCCGDVSIRMEMVARAQTPLAKVRRANTRKENGFQQGKNNSQFGTTWVWHELIGNVKIKKHLLPEYIDQGWYKKYVPGYRV